MKSHTQPRLVKQRQLKSQLRRERKLFLHPCCQSIKLKLIVISTNLEYRERRKKKEREIQRKGESRRQASEAQRGKERQRASARDKKQRRHFLLEKQHENFEVAMRN